jgi:hypothetical protein
VDQVDEQIEDLRPNIDQLCAAPQLPATSTEYPPNWNGTAASASGVAPETCASSENQGYFHG